MSEPEDEDASTDRDPHARAEPDESIRYRCPACGCTRLRAYVATIARIDQDTQRAYIEDEDRELKLEDGTRVYCTRCNMTDDARAFDRVAAYRPTKGEKE